MRSAGDDGGRGRRAAARLVLAGACALLAACDAGPDPLAVEVTDGTAGHYGGPCGDGESCDAGLVCRDHVCVTAP